MVTVPRDQSTSWSPVDSSPTHPLDPSCPGGSRSCSWCVPSPALGEPGCLGPLPAWNSWQPTMCVCACVGANPSNICQALCDPRSFQLQGWDGWVHRARAGGGGWRVPGLPVQGSACVTRLQWQLCACTHMSCVASKASGGDKWHWGSQQPSWLWGPGIQQVEVGVLDGINQS